MRRTLTVVAVLVAVFMLFPPVATVVAAEEGSAGPPITPDSPVYFLGQIMEQVQLRIMRDPADRVELIAGLLQRRAIETEAVMGQGRPEHAPGLLDAAQDLSGRLQSEAAGLDWEEVDANDIAETIDGATEVALEKLGELLPDDNDENDNDENDMEVPEEARKGLENALDQIQENRGFAHGVLQAIIDGDIPGDAGRAQERLNRAMQRGENGPPEAPGRPDNSEEDQGD